MQNMLQEWRRRELTNFHKKKEIGCTTKNGGYKKTLQMIGDKERISSNIVKTRHRLGINQSAFARELGISRAGLRLYEKGERLINTEVLLKLYEKYEVTPNEILIDKG